MPYVTRAVVDAFLAGRTLAVVGASRSRKKFGNVVYRELRDKGSRVLAVNPCATEVEGDPCVPSVADLPQPPDGAVLVVPPAVSEEVVEACGRAGIRRIWFQHGSWTPAVVESAKARGLAVVHGECILMYGERVGFVHRIHRGLRSLLGRMPR